MLDAILAELIEQHYGVQIAAVSPLAGTMYGESYRVELADGTRWVARVFSAEDHLPVSDAVMLRFLEVHGYPAERPVRTTHGEIVVRDGQRSMLVTTFIDGVAIDYSAPSLYQLGAAIGRLHALEPAARDEPLPTAVMLPSREVAWALGELHAIDGQIPKHLQDEHARLAAALESIDVSEPSHVVPIHNDAHPSNALLTADGTVNFIDWGGAGLGPPEIDVGFLAISCDTESPWTPPLPPDPRRIAAMVDGYCRHHRLRPEELERLPDAMRFRSLVYGAGDLVRVVSEGVVVQPEEWWWARYKAVDELAHRVRERFEMWMRA